MPMQAQHYMDGGRMNIKGIRKGDKIILKGSRKQPVKVLSKKPCIVKYKSKQGKTCHLILNKFTGKGYDMRNGSAKMVSNVIKGGR